MYKCLSCGNTDAFEGYVEEKGSARIIQYDDGSYSWAYAIGAGQPLTQIQVIKCASCGSCAIESSTTTEIQGV